MHVDAQGPAPVAQQHDGLVGEGDERTRVREERRAVLGHLGSTVRAVEEHRTEIGFEPCDALGDRLLAQAEADGRLAEGALLGDGDEGADGREVQVRLTSVHNRWLSRIGVSVVGHPTLPFGRMTDAAETYNLRE
ncbi:hypothetical protein GCM10029978_010990 [Actinoallomurus acanthiterrae]